MSPEAKPQTKSPDEIRFFSRCKPEWRWLSNFADAPFEFRGCRYPSVEVAYHSFKQEDPAWRLWILSSKDAKEANARGKKAKLWPQWHAMKHTLMADLVRAKFSQNPELAARLVATGDAKLVHIQPWRASRGRPIVPEHDTLGEAIMQVRASLREE